MPQVAQHPGELTRDLFDAFVSGALDRFLAGCCEDLLLTVRGSGSLTTLVAKADIASWYASMVELAGTLRSEVGMVLSEDRTQIVLLRHALIRGGAEHHYETVNRCTFRDGSLASWFSHPVRAEEYARAWGLPSGVQRVSA